MRACVCVVPTPVLTAAASAPSPPPPLPALQLKVKVKQQAEEELGASSGGGGPPSPDKETEEELLRLAKDLFAEMSAEGPGGARTLVLADAVSVCNDGTSREVLDAAANRSPRGTPASMPSMDDAQWTAFMLHTGRKEGYGTAIATFTAMLQEWRIAHNRTAPSTAHTPSELHRSGSSAGGGGDSASASHSSASGSGEVPAEGSAEALKQRSALVAISEELFRLLDVDDCGSILAATTREVLDTEWDYALAREDNETNVLDNQDWVKLCLAAGRRDGAARIIETFRGICDGIKRAKALRERSQSPVSRSPSPAPAQHTRPPLVLSPEQREVRRVRNEWRAKHAPFVSSITAGKTSGVVSESVKNMLWRIPDASAPPHREVGAHVAVREVNALAQMRAAVGELKHPHFVESAHRIADAAHKEADGVDVILARVAALEAQITARERVVASQCAKRACDAARAASDAAGGCALTVDHILLAHLRPTSPSDVARKDALAKHDLENELYDLRYRTAAIAAPLEVDGHFGVRISGLAAILAQSSGRIGTLEAAVSVSLRGELAAQSRRLAMLEYRCALLDAGGGEGTARFLASPHQQPAFAAMPSEKVVDATDPSFDAAVVRAAKRSANAAGSSGLRPPPVPTRVPSTTTTTTTLRAKTPAAAQRWLEALSGVGWTVASRGNVAELRSHVTPTGGRKCSTFHTPSIRFAPRATCGDDNEANVVCEGPLELLTLQAGGLKRAWEERSHCVLRASGALVLTKRLLRATRRASNSTTLASILPGDARLDPLDPRLFHLERYADEEKWHVPHAAEVASPNAAAFSPQRVETFIRVGRRYSTASSAAGVAPARDGAAMRLASATPLPAVQTTCKVSVLQ